jgi:tRNA pseudouridine38-40 synthase
VQDRAYYYPYKLDLLILRETASIIKEYSDFTTFAKRNTQVKTFECRIHESRWLEENDCLVYAVKANRFLRGDGKGINRNNAESSNRKNEYRQIQICY